MCTNVSIRTFGHSSSEAVLITENFQARNEFIGNYLVVNHRISGALGSG